MSVVFKNLFYPGNRRQPCTVAYAIALSNSDGDGRTMFNVMLMDVEGENVGGTSPVFGESPNYIVNKIWKQELSDFMLYGAKFYQCQRMLPEQEKTIFQWPFKLKKYKSVLDRINGYREIEIIVDEITPVSARQAERLDGVFCMNRQPTDG